jgi:drug/metabolite transporter (DMT)-like permease
MKWIWFQFIFGLTVIGLFGAKVSKDISAGKLPWYSSIGLSILSGALWGYVASKPIPLTYASVVFDVIYTAAYVAGFVWLGDSLNNIQILGIIFSIIGVILMGWH